MAGPLVAADGLCKVYQPSPRWMRALLRTAIREPVVALDEVSLTVDAGMVCAVAGPNGAGKSTLLRLLTGLSTPTAGSARVMGIDTSRQSMELRRQIGFMPGEQRSLQLRLTCRENLAYYGRLQGLGRRLDRRIAEVLEFVGLSDAANRVGFALSAGMRARLQLARALLHEPTVLILDEPTSSVDPIGSYELLQLLQQLATERGLAVLISSHRLEEIEALHDHVVLLDRGRVIFDGDLNDLRELWERPQIELAFDHEHQATAAAARMHGVNLVDVRAVDPPRVTVTSEQPTSELLATLGRQLIGLKSVTQSRIPLLELFTTVLQGNGVADPEESVR